MTIYSDCCPDESIWGINCVLHDCQSATESTRSEHRPEKSMPTQRLVHEQVLKRMFRQPKTDIPPSLCSKVNSEFRESNVYNCISSFRRHVYIALSNLLDPEGFFERLLAPSLTSLLYCSRKLIFS